MNTTEEKLDRLIELSEKQIAVSEKILETIDYFGKHSPNPLWQESVARHLKEIQASVMRSNTFLQSIDKADNSCHYQ